MTLLSQRFFALLTEACATFDALFADQARTNQQRVISCFLGGYVGCEGGSGLCALLSLRRGSEAIGIIVCSNKPKNIHTQTGRNVPIRSEKECLFARLVLWIDAETRRYAALVGA